MNELTRKNPIDDVDRRLIRATQEGLPLCRDPFGRLAQSLALDPDDVMARFRRMLAAGIVRRIGAVPNHYRIGYGANGMSVWDVPDELVAVVGPEIGALDFVSHCYQRPRHPPDWPYNVFAMVHGRSSDEVEAKVAEIVRIIAGRERGHAVLYSARILKKTGLRISG